MIWRGQGEWVVGVADWLRHGTVESVDMGSDREGWSLGGQGLSEGMAGVQTLVEYGPCVRV